MAPTTPTGPPSRLIAGDSVRFRIADHADYPQSEGWTLAYDLVGVGVLPSASITVAWQATGDDQNHWLVTITAAATSGLPEGRYRLIGRFVGSGTYAGRRESLPALDTVVVVRPNPAQAADGEFQTENERNLLAVRTIIRARLDGDVPESYEVAGRSLEKMSIGDLRTLEAQYAWAVRAERSGRLGRRHLARFPGA